MAQNNYEISKRDIIEIFRQIVIDFPYSECKQLQTFAMLEDGDNLVSSQAFPATYQSYLDGFYWSRDWYASGADANQMQLEYPALFLEQIGSKRKDINKRGKCFKFVLLIADIPDCTSCPEKCKRSKSQVICDIEDALDLVMGEFIKYQLFEAEVGGETVYIWATQNKKEKLIDDDVYTTLTYTGMDIDTNLQNYQLDYKPWQTKRFSNAEDLIGSFIELEFCGCVGEQAEFTYNNINPKLVAHSKCTEC